MWFRCTFQSRVYGYDLYSYKDGHISVDDLLAVFKSIL